MQRLEVIPYGNIYLIGDMGFILFYNPLLHILIVRNTLAIILIIATFLNIHSSYQRTQSLQPLLKRTLDDNTTLSCSGLVPQHRAKYEAHWPNFACS